MKTNYEVVRKLMKDHVDLAELKYQMDMLNITLPYIGNIDLFEIILDIIGFPEVDREQRVIDEDGEENVFVARSKWTEEAHCLERDGDIDAFLDSVYAEYDELLLEQPELFRSNVSGTED